MFPDIRLTCIQSNPSAAIVRSRIGTTRCSFIQWGWITSAGQIWQGSHPIHPSLPQAGCQPVFCHARQLSKLSESSNFEVLPAVYLKMWDLQAKSPRSSAGATPPARVILDVRFKVVWATQFRIGLRGRATVVASCHAR